MSQPADRSPRELLNEGRLVDALSAAKAAVRSAPADVDERLILSQLLCLNGELERADQQLETVSGQQPKVAVAAAMMRQLIRAAVARNECLRQGRPPELWSEPDEGIRRQLELQLALREGATARAAEVARAIETDRRPLNGRSADGDFEDLRDMDDSWSAMLEVMTGSGKYYWVPWHEVASIDVSPPKSPCDLLWARAKLQVRSGFEGQVFLPAIYPATSDGDPEPLRIGHDVAWEERGEGFVLGKGLRMFWLGAADKSIFDLREVVLHDG